MDGSERYFRVGASMMDHIVNLQNVDIKSYTAHQIESAPVFRLTTGEMVGIIYSAGDWGDVKMGLHRRVILTDLKELCVIEPDATER